MPGAGSGNSMLRRRQLRAGIPAGDQPTRSTGGPTQSHPHAPLRPTAQSIRRCWSGTAEGGRGHHQSPSRHGDGILPGARRGPDRPPAQARPSSETDSGCASNPTCSSGGVDAHPASTCHPESSGIHANNLTLDAHHGCKPPSLALHTTHPCHPPRCRATKAPITSHRTASQKNTQGSPRVLPTPATLPSPSPPSPGALTQSPGPLDSVPFTCADSSGGGSDVSLPYTLASVKVSLVPVSPLRSC